MLFIQRTKRKMTYILTHLGIRNRNNVLMVAVAILACVLVIRHLRTPVHEMSIDHTDNQKWLDYIASHVKIHITPRDNFNSGPLQIILFNDGPADIMLTKWRIYFNNIVGHSAGILGCGLSLTHVNGGLYYLSPKQFSFSGLKANQRLSCAVGHKGCAVSKSDFLPNWYVWHPDGYLVPKVIENTQDETMSFVGPFDKPQFWKRNPDDLYNPFTPEDRFRANDRPKPINSDTPRIIPKPIRMSTLSTATLTINSSWTIIKSVRFSSAVSFLKTKLRLAAKAGHDACSRCIYFQYSTEPYEVDEYELEVFPAKSQIIILAQNQAGAFYGVQTLLSLVARGMAVPHVLVEDRPRFEYRGLMLDVARNFISKDAILAIIDVMAMYKLNRLHLHLNDDEAWRLEIPSIPELTKIGAKRCYRFETKECLIPSLGSGPSSNTSGSGYYTVTDYRDIVRYAAERFVRVIPEIDMPGHALAAITSMKQRVDRYTGTSEVVYPLNEDNAMTESINNYYGNVVCPCLNSTYKFIEVVMDTLIRLHKDVQDLAEYHFGGDEVSESAWRSSKSCQTIGKSGNAQIKSYFVQKVAELAAKKGLNLSAWEDGLYGNEGPYKKETLPNKELYTYIWKNIWELGQANRVAYFTDVRYKVILSMATHLYLDHPYEPDPDERGLYWATRYTDTARVFGFLPNRIYDNADHYADGRPVDLTEYCATHECPRISHLEDIIGIQACLWGETVRQPEQVHEMLFPRLLAVAERAWHQADWETITQKGRFADEKSKDWGEFVDALGMYELPRLDRLGMHYRVPIPGAHVDPSKNSLVVNTLYPNHRVLVTFDGANWLEVKDSVDIPKGAQSASLKAVTPHVGRESREIKVELVNR